MAVAHAIFATSRTHALTLNGTQLRGLKQDSVVGDQSLLPTQGGADTAPWLPIQPTNHNAAVPKDGLSKDTLLDRAQGTPPSLVTEAVGHVSSKAYPASQPSFEGVANNSSSDIQVVSSAQHDPLAEHVRTLPNLTGNTAVPGEAWSSDQVGPTNADFGKLVSAT